MGHYHDPIREINDIQQILSQDKKPIGIFLSAGCPMSIHNIDDGKPLIPNITGLTKVVCDELNCSKNTKLISKVLDNLKNDGNNEPNIEDILSHIRSLLSVAGKDSVRGLTASELEQLDIDICAAIVKCVNKNLPNNDTAYNKLAAWIGSVPRNHPVELFTTNYDLLMEQALEKQRIPYFDGFLGSYNPFFDPHAIEEDVLPSRWARLWKLHGSINWYKNDSGAVSRGKLGDNGHCYVIHPSHLKYDESRRMPYIAMIERLNTFIKKPSSVLITCGYSFRDEHINANILDSLQGNTTAVVFALVYGDLDNYSKAIQLANAIPNFNLLAENEAIIGTKRLSWTEKDNPEIPKYNAIEWIDAGKTKKSKFKLGDFQLFCALLEDIIGSDNVKGRN